MNFLKLSFVAAVALVAVQVEAKTCVMRSVANRGKLTTLVKCSKNESLKSLVSIEGRTMEDATMFLPDQIESVKSELKVKLVSCSTGTVESGVPFICAFESVDSVYR